jgi:hypothetical protein
MRTGWWRVTGQKVLYIIPCGRGRDRMCRINRYIDRMLRAQPRIRWRRDRNIDRRRRKPRSLAWVRWLAPRRYRMSRLPWPRPDFRRRSTGRNRMRWVSGAWPDSRRLLWRIIDRRHRGWTSRRWTSADTHVGIGHCANDSNGNCSHFIIFLSIFLSIFLFEYVCRL